MKMWIKLCVVVLPILLSGCVSTQPAAKMREIQMTKGFFTTSLWYLGSTKKYHYFDQSRGNLFSTKESFKRFRVPFTELMMPEDLVFPYGSSDQRPEGIWGVGDEEPQGIKVRITKYPPYAVVPRKRSSNKTSRKLHHAHQELKVAVQRVNGTLMVLFELPLPLSRLSSSFKNLHGRWPSTAEEFRSYAIANGGQDGPVDWSSCENFVLRELEDGSLEIRFTYAGTPVAFTVPSSSPVDGGHAD